MFYLFCVSPSLFGSVCLSHVCLCILCAHVHVFACACTWVSVSDFGGSDFQF